MIPSPPSEQAEPHAQAAGRPRDEPCVLLKLGEIVLKGKNRQHFGRILHDNLRAALRDTGIPFDMRQRDGVILLRVTDGASRGPDGWAAAAAALAERAGDVPGIVTVARPIRVAKTPEAVVAAAVALTAKKAGTFAVRARRRDKRFPLTSAELAVLVGREIQEGHGLDVTLRNLCEKAREAHLLDRCRALLEDIPGQDDQNEDDHPEKQVLDSGVQTGLLP